MKRSIIPILLIWLVKLHAQDTEVVFSENHKFYLETVSYGDFEDKTLGRTTVFSADSTQLYTIDRRFVVHRSSQLILSNDGQIVCLITNGEKNNPYELERGLILYKEGQLFREHLKSALIKCRKNEADCNLLYFKAVKDFGIDSTGKQGYIFHHGTTQFEKFLCDTNVFVSNNTAYVFTDSDSTIILNLVSGDYEKEHFTTFNKSTLLNSMYIPSSTFYSKGKKGCWDFPRTKCGKKFEIVLAEVLNMKIYDEDSRGWGRYNKYSMSLKCLIDTNGKAELLAIEAHDSIDTVKVYQLFNKIVFRTDCNYKHTDKTAFNLIGFGLRHKSNKVSRQEKIKGDKLNFENYQKRLAMDSINGFYIPTNLGDCMLTLDKLLNPKDIDVMRNLGKPEDMIQYHHGLGMYLRNNWGLWGGSKLRQYFLRRNITHPDSMSGIILRYYHDWINGNLESWREWEQQNPIKN